MRDIEDVSDAEMVSWKESRATKRLLMFLNDSVEDIKSIWVTSGYKNADHTVEMRNQAGAQGQAQGYLKILEWIDNIKMPELEQKEPQSDE
jgi:hypothetical protein